MYKCKICGQIIDNNNICPFCGSDSSNIIEIEETIEKKNKEKYYCLNCGHELDSNEYCEFCGASKDYIIEKSEYDKIFSEPLVDDTTSTLVNNEETNEKVEEIENNINEEEKLDSLKEEDNTLTEEPIKKPLINKEEKQPILSENLANLDYLIRIYKYFVYKDYQRSLLIKTYISNYIDNKFTLENSIDEVIDDISDEDLKRFLNQFKDK